MQRQPFLPPTFPCSRHFHSILVLRYDFCTVLMQAFAFLFSVLCSHCNAFGASLSKTTFCWRILAWMGTLSYIGSMVQIICETLTACGLPSFILASAFSFLLFFPFTLHCCWLPSFSHHNRVGPVVWVYPRSLLHLLHRSYCTLSTQFGPFLQRTDADPTFPACICHSLLFRGCSASFCNMSLLVVHLVWHYKSNRQFIGWWVSQS